MQMATSRLQEEIRHSTVHTFIDDIFGEDMHAKRVQSLSGWIQANCPLVDGIYILTPLPSSMSCVSA
jgi:hypothetical protein